MKRGPWRLWMALVLALSGILLLVCAALYREGTSATELADARSRLKILRARLDRELECERPKGETLLDVLTDMRSAHTHLTRALEPLPGERDAEFVHRLTEFDASLDLASERAQEYAVHAECLDQGLRRLPGALAEYRARSVAAVTDADTQAALDRISHQIERYALGLPTNLQVGVLDDLDVLRLARSRIDPERRDALDRVLIHVAACRMHDAEASQQLARMQGIPLGEAAQLVEFASLRYAARHAEVLDFVRAVAIGVALAILAALVYACVRLDLGRGSARADGPAIERRVRDRTAQLTATNAELARALASSQRSALEAQAASARAEAKSAAKSDFLARMSHEIRTPMTSILGYSQQLSEPGLSARDRAEALHTIQRNGEHLLELVNDILDLSKIEAGRLEIERVECSLFQVLLEVRAAMQVRAIAKGLDFRVVVQGDVPETLVTDPIRLRQILLNLVGNAIKFTEIGSVRLDVELCENEGRRDSASTGYRLKLTIADTGIGMSADEVSRLFRPFMQADRSTTRRFGGTGLGLSITKELVGMLGGTIAIDSHPDAGSTFTIEIEVGVSGDSRFLSTAELEQLAGSSSIDESESDVPKLACRILVAEDSPDTRRLLVHWLEPAGAHVSLAENGEVAFQRVVEAKIAGKSFDVVLMDLQMPVLDGVAATARLRALGYSLPILALTADVSAYGAREALQAGCDDVCAKPIDKPSLLATIARHVGHRTASVPLMESRRSIADETTDVKASDPELLHLVGMFLDDLAHDGVAMHAAFRADDMQALARLAHRLKGTAGSYGFPALTDQAARLERSAKASGTVDDVERELAALDALCRATRTQAKS